MVVVGALGDQFAQQPLHVVQTPGLLGHHGLVIEEVGFLGESRHGLGVNLVGLLPGLGISQQLRLGHQFHPCIFGAPLGVGAQQRACFIQTALPGQQGGPSHLRRHDVVAVLDPVQPGGGALEIAALFRHLGQQQIGLGGASQKAFVTRRARQRQVALQRRFGRLWRVVLGLHGAQQQPGLGQIRLFAGQLVQQGAGVGRPLQVQQQTGVGQGNR